jgi:hypothetical protein
MRTKFDKKKQNQTTKDEIENKIQLKIININKTIVIKKRRIKSKKKEIEGLI